MYIILIKDNHRYRIYTNEIFTLEDEALDYAKRCKIKVKWKVEKFDYKYFNNKQQEGAMHLSTYNKKSKVLNKKYKYLERLLKERHKVYSIQDKKIEKEQIELERLDRRVYRINFLLSELDEQSRDLVDEYQGRTWYDELVEYGQYIYNLEIVMMI